MKKRKQISKVPLVARIFWSFLLLTVVLRIGTWNENDGAIHTVQAFSFTISPPSLLRIRSRSVLPGSPLHLSLDNKSSHNEEFIPASLQLHNNAPILPQNNASKQRTTRYPNRQRQQQQQQQQHSKTHNIDDNSIRLHWLNQATNNFLLSPPGTLVKGKWHQVVSMLKAWSDINNNNGCNNNTEAPFCMEALVKRLVEEKRAGNREVVLTVQLYNRVLDAWACAALQKHNNVKASQRAREILVLLQETYEQTSNELLQPNKESFQIVLHCVCKTEGAIVARRILAWMEHLYKTNKNLAAKPTKEAVILILDAYANSGEANAGVLADAFMRHMQITAGIQPDTVCYNIAIKAHSRSVVGGSRQVAEQADRILYEMNTPPDLVTYSTVIAAWAASGMKAHAVSRVEDILRVMEQQKLEANTIVLNAVMSTWVKSRNPAAVERTAELLKQMELSSWPSSSWHSSFSSCAPDLFSYNTHLHALSMHSHKNPEYAHRADAILRKLERESDAGRRALSPNPFTYNLVIEAFCRSKTPNSSMLAANVLRRLIQRDGVEPDTFSFNQVLSALSKSGAARTAEDLLVYMEEAYRSGIHPNAKPDAMSYSSVTVAYARSGEKGAAEQAEKLLERMNAQYLAGVSDVKPSRICYNALIDCWAKSGEGTFGARKAEAVLERMQAMFDAGDTSMAPDLVTFNAVLNAWARSGTRCCGRKAETYLNRMWDLYLAGDKRVKPNDFSYNTVINAISKSKDERKAQKALRVLRRMDKLYQAGNKEARPNEITYTAVLNSCAFPAAGDPNIRRKAFDTAIFTLEELQRSRYGQPNQITYGTFIKACANLLPDDDETRRNVIKRAWLQCCQDGQVGDMVLSQIRRAAPADLMKELLADIVQQTSSGGTVVSVNDLPLEWRCNVKRVEQKQWKRVKSTNRSAATATRAATTKRQLGKRNSRQPSSSGNPLMP